MDIFAFFSNIRALHQFNAFLNRLAKDYSVPVFPSAEEVSAFLEQKRQTPIPDEYFYLVAHSTDITIPFHFNTEAHLDISGEIDADKFLRLTHPYYISRYLKLAAAAYYYIRKMRDQLVPLTRFFRITYPIRLSDGKYYWVQAEITPLQLDRHNNMISHFNVYKVLRKFNPKQKLPLLAEFWDADFRDEIWTEGFRQVVTSARGGAFMLTPSESAIIHLLRRNPNLTNAQLAQSLNKGKETIDSQNKNILDKAEASFRQRFTVRELVQLLDQAGILQEDVLPLLLKHGDKIPLVAN